MGLDIMFVRNDVAYDLLPHTSNLWVKLGKIKMRSSKCFPRTSMANH